MESRWLEQAAQEFLDRYAGRWGEDLALRTYSCRLLGSEPSLVLHGGGNASVKTTRTNRLGEAVPALYVKASGYDMASIEPEGHTALDLRRLLKLRALADLPDEAMVDEFRTHLLDPHAGTPSIETLAHAFLPGKFIDHTHADALLALTNQPDGERLVREALGESALVLGYVKPGFPLAKAAAEASESNPGPRAMVWMHHGLICWGETARDSYETTIDLVSRAESYLEKNSSRPLRVQISTPVEEAEERLAHVAPVLRGALSPPTGDPDRPRRRMILRILVNREVLDFVGSDRGRQLALSAPLTTDHLIRTKPLPLWVDDPRDGDPEQFRGQLAEAIAAYVREYDGYFERNASRMPPGLTRFDPFPRVVLHPGIGAVCSGRDVLTARIASDITAHTLRAKARAAAVGIYRGLSEEHLFDMEYRGMQHAKIAGELEKAPAALAGSVALVTGAAGAIGSGICEELLEAGCHVAPTDLPGERLDSFVSEARGRFGERVLGVPLDVTDPASVAGGFGQVIEAWGGIDLVVINAGIAHVSPLVDLGLEEFRRLERVNVEGTLLLLSESARHFELQGMGGDIVLVSSKNVFAPGAGFGAYSATKAGAHQLGRIASLELAGIGVRVNMVAPDAVFAAGGRRSGLWDQVGPARMRARGLDEKALRDYYRDRSLLKVEVTARHVAKAVLFFATRQTPTTGATIPVDGGLPDATPR